MKRIILIASVFFAIFICAQRTEAQARVSINIGSQPGWGPVGYDHVDYYYLPDIDAYYYVPGHQFVYPSHGHWVFASTLPPRYHNYDLYSGYKVVMNEPQPYLHDNVYRDKYAQYRDRHDQVAIRDSHDQRYAHHDNGRHNKHGDNDDQRRHHDDK